MKILVVDDVKQKGTKIAEALTQEQHDAQFVNAANDFLTILNEDTPERIVLSLDAWNSGKSIYNYFEITGMLENIPIVYYDTPDEFSGLPSRPAHNKDRVLSKEATVEQVIDAALNME